MGKIKWMYEITKEKKGKYLKRKSLFILGLLFSRDYWRFGNLFVFLSGVSFSFREAAVKII